MGVARPNQLANDGGGAGMIARDLVSPQGHGILLAAILRCRIFRPPAQGGIELIGGSDHEI